MDFGYREESFTAPILEGLRGLTIGWRKGILWFLPDLPACPLGRLEAGTQPAEMGGGRACGDGAAAFPADLTLAHV